MKQSINGGEKIFGIKEEPSYLLAVIDGEVELRQDQPMGTSTEGNAISNLSEKMIFGWSGLVPPFEYRLAAYCVTRRCRVLKIDRNCLSSAFKKDSALGYKVMSKIVSVVGTRFYQLREEIIKQKGQEIINQW